MGSLALCFVHTVAVLHVSTLHLISVESQTKFVDEV